MQKIVFLTLLALTIFITPIARAECPAAEKITGIWQAPIIYRIAQINALLTWQKNLDDTFDIIVDSSAYKVHIRAAQFLDDPTQSQNLNVTYNEQTADVPVFASCQKNIVVISFTTENNRTLTLEMGVECDSLQTYYSKLNNNSRKKRSFQIGLVRK
jgi:hypothetical protein